MRWTKLKQLIEARFAESLQGRLELHITRYRKSHDALHEFWATLDSKRIFECSDGKSYAFAAQRRKEIEAEGKLKFAAAEAFDEAVSEAPFASDLMSLLFLTLSMPLQQMLQHENSVVRALGIADARYGKRKLCMTNENLGSLLEQTIFDFRRQLELDTTAINRPMDQLRSKNLG